MKFNIRLNLLVAALAAISSSFVAGGTAIAQTPIATTQHSAVTTVAYKTVSIDGLDVFYREAGPRPLRHCCCCTASRLRRTCSGI
jgi:hypothetical protein